MDEFVQLLQNPAHWGFEAVTDVFFGGLAFVAGRIPFQRWVARHDKEHHG